MMNCFPACRMLIDRVPNSGSWNMAVDELLLEQAVNEKRCTVRLYEWDRATVSLGYFQDAEECSRIAEFANLPKVRRLSGGGAILHHHELTYSCALPATHPIAAEPHRLYELVHQQILVVLEHYRISARIRGTEFNKNEREKVFLCFGRGDARDIVFCGHKILGSAQRRRRGAVLQHGSLIFKRSVHTPQHPGILDLHPAEFSQSTLKTELATSLGLLICENSEDFSLSESERIRIKQLQKQRYSRLNWKNSIQSRSHTVRGTIPAI